MITVPPPSHILIAISFLLAYMWVADNIHLKLRFAMKRFIAWLFLRPLDMVFLRRLQSIEKHIHYAVDQVSFEVLRAAQSRIDYELKYTHTQKERDLIAGLQRTAQHAEETIKNILILENHIGMLTS